MRAVVVDLPLVPVMATKRASGSARASSSTSQRIGLPAARAARAAGCGWGSRFGMPGLMIKALACDQSNAAGSTNLAPMPAACSRDDALSSQATHSIPAAARARTVARLGLEHMDNRYDGSSMHAFSVSDTAGNLVEWDRSDSATAAWAYSKQRKPEFDAAARIPLEDQSENTP